MRWKLLAVPAALLCAGTLAASTLGPAAANAATSGNLIINGDAESGLCTTTGLDTTTLPGWTITSGGPDAVCYGASGYPTSSSPGPASRGNAFFAGGSKGNAQMQQLVSVSSAASAINGGGVTYNLSGWLGGYASQTDNAGVVATFEKASGGSLGTASLAPVTPAQRSDTTELLSESATGTVPPDTAQILVQVTFTYGAGNSTDGYLDDLSLTLSAPVTAPVLAPPPSNVPRFQHVFLVYMENENENASQAPANSGDYIVGNPAAPYLNNTVAPMGALLSDMTATQHPSDPNYIAIAAASALNTDSDFSPGQLSAPNLADELNAADLTWKGYAGGMTGDCDETNHDTASGGYYLDDDDPLMDFADNVTPASYCDAHNQPLTALATDLQSASATPDFVWFDANDYQDMELGGVSAGDSWLSSELPLIFSSPAWTTQNSLLIVTWDEGYTKSYGPSYPDNVPAYLVASQGQIKPGVVSSQYYDDYSLGATIEQALGLPPMNANDEYAQSVDDIWTGTGGGGGTGGQPWLVPITNPGAETGSCSSSGSGSSNVGGWTVTGSPQQVCYGASGFPTSAEGPQAPAVPGNAFFGGGDDKTATMTQTVTVSSQSSQINAGNDSYSLSAWLGGYSSQADNAGLVATFLSAAGTSLGTASLAPVTPAQRDNQTELLNETGSGTVPAGTVSIKFVLTYTRSAGTFNDGYADDLSMTLG
jgi:phosphoesterase family protein